MSLFSAIAEVPVFRRAVAGGILGGAMSFRVAQAKEHGDETTSAIAKVGATLFGVAAGAAVGATFPQWSKSVGENFKNIHAAYGPNLEKNLTEAEKAFNVRHAKVHAEAVGKGLHGEAYAKKMAELGSAPSKTDFGIRAKAALDTYMKPQLAIPAGMLLGSAYAANRGQDPINGAMNGGLVTAGLGLGYHGFRVYQGYDPIRKAVVGASLAPMAYLAGTATNEPQYAEEARAVPTMAGYQAQTLMTRHDSGYNSGAGARAQMMDATGDLVFGLQNMRHG